MIVAVLVHVVSSVATLQQLTQQQSISDHEKGKGNTSGNEAVKTGLGRILFIQSQHDTKAMR